MALETALTAMRRGCQHLIEYYDIAGAQQHIESRHAAQLFHVPP